MRLLQGEYDFILESQLLYEGGTLLPMITTGILPRKLRPLNSRRGLTY
jgi:hypothetical protein